MDDLIFVQQCYDRLDRNEELDDATTAKLNAFTLSMAAQPGLPVFAKLSMTYLFEWESSDRPSR